MGGTAGQRLSLSTGISESTCCGDSLGGLPLEDVRQCLPRWRPRRPRHNARRQERLDLGPPLFSN